MVHAVERHRSTEARIGLTNMGSTPLRADAVERRWPVPTPSAEAIAAAAEHAAEGTSAPSDLSGKADYREHLATRAHQAGRARRGRHLTERRAARALLHRSGRHRRRLEGAARHRARSRRACPGAAIDTVDGDDFTGTVKVKLGPINLTYKGKASFVEKDEAAHRAVIDAQGRDARGNGTAAAKVTATLHRPGRRDQGRRCITDLDITGKPAQFGRGVMVDVGNKLIGQFADCLAGKLSGNPEPAAARRASSSHGARGSHRAGSGRRARNGHRARGSHRARNGHRAGGSGRLAAGPAHPGGGRDRRRWLGGRGSAGAQRTRVRATSARRTVGGAAHRPARRGRSGAAQAAAPGRGTGGGRDAVPDPAPLRTGGTLLYTMTAVGAAQVEFMANAGLPLSTSSRKTFTELDGPRRLGYQSLIDFVPGRQLDNLAAVLAARG